VNQTVLMCLGASVFGVSVWGVLLAAYFNGREASTKDMEYGHRAPLAFPEGQFATQPAYTRVDRDAAIEDQQDDLPQ
jgi:hypothetical protein